MTTIPGASRFINAATLANKEGLAAQTPTLLGNNGSTTSLLQAGRRLSVSGIGLSSSARAINEQFLNNTALTNELLSLTVGPGATQEGAAQQILALRASLPDSSLAPSLRGEQVDEEA